MAVTTVWTAVLIYGVFAGTVMDSASAVIPLDMAPNSVDDTYDGCKVNMKSKVESEFLPNEKNTNGKFKEAWDWAGKKYDSKFRNKKGLRNKKLGTTLGREQVMALYIYSFGPGDIYRDINNAVRTQRSMYGTTFGYHALHFYLTDAIQTLNARKPMAERCITGYRGVDVSFSQDVLNKEIRFGSFTSSTMAGYKIALKFGDKSCFEIKTCYGADISMHSKFGEYEAEVLIPPYEVFKVTKITKRSQDKNLPCDVEYTVESTRTLSNLKCAFFPK